MSTSTSKPQRRRVFTSREGDQWYAEVLDMDTGETMHSTGMHPDENTAYWEAKFWAEDISEAASPSGY